jgi:hypothetical protein
MYLHIGQSRITKKVDAGTISRPDSAQRTQNILVNHMIKHRPLRFMFFRFSGDPLFRIKRPVFSFPNLRVYEVRASVGHLLR